MGKCLGLLLDDMVFYANFHLHSSRLTLSCDSTQDGNDTPERTRETVSRSVCVCVCACARPRLTKQEDPRPANLPRMGLAAAFKVVEARVVAAGVVLAMLLCMPVCHLYLCVDNDLLRKPCKLDPPEDTPEATNTLRVPGGLYSCTSLDS